MQAFKYCGFNSKLSYVFTAESTSTKVSIPQLYETAIQEMLFSGTLVEQNVNTDIQKQLVFEACKR